MPVAPRGRAWIPRGLMVVIVLVTAFRPGDISWINDEPLAMEMALRYNHTASHLYGFDLPFTPSPFGLVGTHGARYGPPPVWLDQIFLSFTHNVVLMAALRSLLFSTLTAIALCWLAAVLQVSPWFATVTMLSPWLWFFSRSLWDCTWCIPVTALALAGYAEFLTRHNARGLFVALAGCLLTTLVNFMALAFSIPLLLHLVLLQGRFLWDRKEIALLVLGACGYLFWPFIYYSVQHLSPSVPATNAALPGWLFPLLGAHYFTLGVAGTMPGDGWQDFAAPVLRQIAATCQWISRGALLVSWLGLILAFARGAKALRRPAAAGMVDHLCLLSVAVFLAQTLLDGVARVYFGPHYYAGTWIVYVFMTWLGMYWVFTRIRKIITIWVVAIYAASVVTGIAIIAWTIDVNRGTRNEYFGTSLAQQVAAAAEIARYPGSAIDMRGFPQWRKYPQALKVLLELNGSATTAGAVPQVLAVKYRDDHPGDAAIEVEDVGPR